MHWYTRQVFDKWCAASKWEIDNEELEEKIQSFGTDAIEENEDMEDEIVAESLFIIRMSLIAENMYPDKEEGSWDAVFDYMRPYVKAHYAFEVSEDEEQ